MRFRCLFLFVLPDIELGCGIFNAYFLSSLPDTVSIDKHFLYKKFFLLHLLMIYLDSDLVIGSFKPFVGFLGVLVCLIVGLVHTLEYV